VTWPFQELVNTYGQPRYGEVNPGLFTIVTFPFEFGIMFGDIGHGVKTTKNHFIKSILFLFGAFLVIFGESFLKSVLKNNRSEPLECRDVAMLHKARYLFFLLGCFAAYCGFIYNDCFSISLNYVPSCYEG
jgi:V-type H+-transporting ATPase subunit a